MTTETDRAALVEHLRLIRLAADNLENARKLGSLDVCTGLESDDLRKAAAYIEQTSPAPAQATDEQYADADALIAHLDSLVDDGDEQWEPAQAAIRGIKQWQQGEPAPAPGVGEAVAFVDVDGGGARLRMVHAPWPHGTHSLYNHPSPVEAAVERDAPWGDLKIAFGCENEDALWSAYDAGSLQLPNGWKLIETDGSCARVVAIFRVAALPTFDDGEAVQAEIRRLEQLAIDAQNKERS